MQSSKRVRLDDLRSPSVEEIPKPVSTHEEAEGDVEGEHCSICLQTLEDRTVIPPCSHEFCFECLLMWTEQSRRCPLCTQPVGDYLIHRIRSKYDYQKHYLPPLRSTSPAPLRPLSSEQSAAVRRIARREREWGRRARREREEADAFERAVRKRRWLYEHDLYAKHVASNPYTRYHPHPTPAQFSASADLQSRAAIFLRRELTIWPNLDVQFLTMFILSLMKSIDIRSESAVKLLAEFLDMNEPYVQGGRYKNAEHFAHEVYSYLRSPYRDLAVYDTVVQYDTPDGAPPPPNDSPRRTNRWRPSTSPPRSRSPLGADRHARAERKSGPSRRVNSPTWPRRTPQADEPWDQSPGEPYVDSRASVGRKRSYDDQTYASSSEHRRHTQASSGRHDPQGQSATRPDGAEDKKVVEIQIQIQADDVFGTNDQPRRGDKGKFKAPVPDHIDLTGHDEVAVPAMGSVSAETPDNRQGLGDMKSSTNFLISPTAPSQVADPKRTISSNLARSRSHATPGGVPARTNEANVALTQDPANRRALPRTRTRMSLRESVHAHLNLNGRTRPPRKGAEAEGSQIQSADLLHSPSMGSCDPGTDVYPASLLNRITESQTRSSHKNTQADEAPASNRLESLVGQALRAGGSPPITSSGSGNTGPPSSRASSSDTSGLRVPLQRKLDQEKRRLLLQGLEVDTSTGPQVAVDALAGSSDTLLSKDRDLSRSSDTRSVDTGDSSVDTVAAEAKLRMQARLRARLAIAKKSLADPQP